MKIPNIIIVISLLGWTTFCFGQNQRLNAFEISYDVGISYDLGAPEVYRTSTFFEDLVTDSRAPARTTNWSIAYKRFINSKNGIKVSFGQTQFGFDFEGKLQNTGTPVRGFFRSNNLEFGISYLRRHPLSKFSNLLLEPGLRYHSDASSGPIISIGNLDVFSLSIYAGIEFPMFDENFFTNVGLQLKLPLQRYNFNFGSDPPYYPYFIGLKIAVNFQFSWTRRRTVDVF